MSASRVGNVNFDLTDGEREVAAELVKGLSNPAIAAALGYSRANVKYHLANLYGKLGVATRGEAIALLLADTVGLEVREIAPTPTVAVRTPDSSDKSYTDAQLRAAAKKLAGLGLHESRLVNGVVRDLLEILNGTL